MDYRIVSTCFGFFDCLYACDYNNNEELAMFHDPCHLYDIYNNTYRYFCDLNNQLYENYALCYEYCNVNLADSVVHISSIDVTALGFVVGFVIIVSMIVATISALR